MIKSLLHRANQVKKDLELIKIISSSWSKNSREEILDKYYQGKIKINHSAKSLQIIE